MDHFWNMGYSAEDIVGNVFKVCKNHTMDEKLKLKFVKVWHAAFTYLNLSLYVDSHLCILIHFYVLSKYS